jgi:hypothetical protein
MAPRTPPYLRCTYIPRTPTPKSSCRSVAEALAAGWPRSNVPTAMQWSSRKDLMTRGASFPFSHLTAWLAQHSRQTCPLSGLWSPTPHFQWPWSARGSCRHHATSARAALTHWSSREARFEVVHSGSANKRRHLFCCLVSFLLCSHAPSPAPASRRTIVPFWMLAVGTN